METNHFQFETPHVAARDPQRITLDLAGERLQLDRPKDWTLGQGGTVVDDMTPLQQRGQAAAEFIHGTLGEEGWDRIVSRAIDRDDPLNLATLIDAIRALLTRWENWNDWDTHVVINPTPGGIHGEPSTVSYPLLGLDHVPVQPPKDLLLLIIHTTASRATNEGAAWVVDIFLAATFPPEVHMEIMRRLRSKTDTVDVVHLDPMLSQLLGHWTAQLDAHELPTGNTPPNRAERRANTAGQQFTGHLS